MKVMRIDPVLAAQKEHRERKQHQEEKTMIEKRRELFRNNVSRSMRKVYVSEEGKGKHIDERI